MPQISLIKYSDIKQAHRFDSEYFKPEYLIVEKRLKNLGSKTFEEILGNKNVFSGPFGSTLKSDSYQSFGIPFIRISDIQDIFIENNNLVYISEEESQRLNSTTLDIDDIVLSKIGTIGRLSLITKELGKVNISENNVGLRLKNLSSSQKRFLLLFLLSKYGQNQILRVGSGNVQLKFNVKDIDNLLLPDFSKFNLGYFEKTYTEIIEKQTQSKELYKQAEEILLAELGLLNHEVNHKKTFSTTKKAINEAHRFDSEYFQPKYDEIIKKLEKTGYVSLGDNESFSIITGNYSESYGEKGINYIRSVNINSDLTISPEDMYKTDLDLGNKFKVETGDIITSRVGSIGTLGYVSEEFNNSFISDNILRIRNNNNNLNNLFIAIYLKKIGTIFMERLQRGSVQQRLNQETLKEIKIPLIKPEIQKEIAEKIELSHRLRKESKELLELAKRKVEEEIEKGI